MSGTINVFLFKVDINNSDNSKEMRRKKSAERENDMIPINTLFSAHSVNKNKGNSTNSLEEAKHNFVNQYKSTILGVDTNDEKVKEKYMRRIKAKLDAGQPLTKKEMNYLRKYEPELYMQVVRVENKRKMVQEQLKHCKSKEEAQRIQDEAIGSISERDPTKKWLISAINYTMEEFKKTDAYNKLPATDEDAKKIKKTKDNELKTKEDKDKDNKDEDEGEETVEHTVEHTVTLGGYQESFVSESGNSNHIKFDSVS